MQLDNPREFYYGLPLVTRVWVTVALIATIGSALGLVSLEYIRLDWESVIGRVHVRARRGPRRASWRARSWEERREPQQVSARP